MEWLLKLLVVVKILAWVAWVHKISACTAQDPKILTWVGKLAWVNNNILYVLCLSVYCESSL